MHPAVQQYNHLVESGFVTQDPMLSATASDRAIANARMTIVEHLHALQTQHNVSKSIETLLNQQLNAQLPVAVSNAFRCINKTPKASTLRNWLKSYDATGLAALLPKYAGTNRKTYGWEKRFLELFHKPQKPSLAKVARDLREKYGHATAKEHNVRYFYNSLPADLQDKSPWRLGRKQYKDALREHISRTTENLDVGVLYQGDGHQIDVYLKHPDSGKLWRPELVVFMDVRSRYIVGWYLSVAESSINTMAALSHAMQRFNHVPAMVHIDNGSGFKSKLMNSETSGFYNNFGIETIFALPGNAKAKNVERFFRTMEDDFGKDFDTYCGYAMSPDQKRLFSDSRKAQKSVAEGKIHLPTIEEWAEGFESWLELYHRRPHPEDRTTTPELLFSELERVEVVDNNLLVKPRADVKVSRELIRLHNRFYRSDSLHQFEGMELVAEYDLHDDSTIRLFDKDGRWLSVCQLKGRKDYVSQSRIEDAKVRRLEEKNKRLANKARENELEANIQRPTHELIAKELDIMPSIDTLEQAKHPQNEPNFDEAATELMDASLHTESVEEELDLLSMLDEQA